MSERPQRRENPESFRNTFTRWTWMAAVLCLTAGCGAAGDSAGPAAAAGPLGDAPPAGSPLEMIPAAHPPVACGSGVLCWAGSLGSQPALYKSWGVSASDLWIVGAQGTLLRWNGMAWSVLAKGSMNDLHGVWGSSSTDVWAVGDGGTILHWNGSAWAQVASPTPIALYAVWGSGPSDVWTVGEGGTILNRNYAARISTYSDSRLPVSGELRLRLTYEHFATS